MNNDAMTILAIAVSLLCLLYLRNTDPKRHSAHRLPSSQHLRYTTCGWLLCLTPGILLLLLQHYAPFILWFATLTIVGWLVAFLRPK